MCQFINPLNMGTGTPPDHGGPRNVPPPSAKPNSNDLKVESGLKQTSEVLVAGTRRSIDSVPSAGQNLSYSDGEMSAEDPIETLDDLIPTSIGGPAERTYADSMMLRQTAVMARPEDLTSTLKDLDMRSVNALQSTSGSDVADLSDFPAADLSPLIEAADTTRRKVPRITVPVHVDGNPNDLSGVVQNLLSRESTEVEPDEPDEEARSTQHHNPVIAQEQPPAQKSFQSELETLVIVRERLSARIDEPFVEATSRKEGWRRFWPAWLGGPKKPK